VLSFANQISDHPVFLPDLEIFHFESHQFSVEDQMARGPAKAFPDRKISETFLQFSAPLLHTLRSDAPERQIREALAVAYTAWKCCHLRGCAQRYIDEARRLTANTDGPAMLIEQMIACKRELFAGDTRLIGNWKVTLTEDGIKLHADARDPHSLPRSPADQH
jgi:hypothetical protein